MGTRKAVLLIVLCSISLTVYSQSKDSKDSLHANNYPNTMPYAPGRIPDYKNDHSNIHDTAFINSHKRAAQADSAAVPKKIKMP